MKNSNQLLSEHQKCFYTHSPAYTHRYHTVFGIEKNINEPCACMFVGVYMLVNKLLILSILKYKTHKHTTGEKVCKQQKKTNSLTSKQRTITGKTTNINKTHTLT